MTGDAFPKLPVVSSQCIGLDVLSCGLTRFELRGLLENVPQLGCQALYAFSVGGITDATTFAITASVLSVTSSVLSFVSIETTTMSKSWNFPVFAPHRARKFQHRLRRRV